MSIAIRHHPVLAAVLLLGAAACRNAPSSPMHPERLDGEWEVEFHLDHAALLHHQPGAYPAVRGRVVLLENESLRAPGQLSGAPTHVGIYSADLRPLGLPAGATVPTLVARLAGADSVEIAFDPVRGPGFQGSGTLQGDSVSGSWWTGGGWTSGRSSGHFVMRRR